MLGKLLAAALIALPWIGVFQLQPLLSAFSPDHHISESRALANGWEIFSCEPPFDRGLQPLKNGRSSCSLVGGKQTLVAEGIKPARQKAGRWPILGVAIRLPSHATQRFMGRTVQVEIEGACDNCSGPIKAVYATGAFGNSGWRDIELGNTLSKVQFSYEVPAKDLADYPDVSPWVVLNPENPDATLRIRRVLVKAPE